MRRLAAEQPAALDELEMPAPAGGLVAGPLDTADWQGRKEASDDRSHRSPARQATVRPRGRPGGRRARAGVRRTDAGRARAAGDDPGRGGSHRAGCRGADRGQRGSSRSAGAGGPAAAGQRARHRPGPAPGRAAGRAPAGQLDQAAGRGVVRRADRRTARVAAASAVIILVGLIGFIGPEFVRTIPPPAFPGNTARTLVVLGLAIASAGVLVAPWLLRGYGLLARSVLAPAGHAELALRVQQLTETRAEVLDTGAAEIRRIERDLHDGAQARLVAMGMTLDAAGQIIDTNPDGARALLIEARDASVKALAELRDLVRGIHPPELADRGLAEAIRALALDRPMRIHLASDLRGRLPEPV